MPRVLAPLVLVLLWLMKIAASPHSLRIAAILDDPMECSRGERLSITLAKNRINRAPERAGKAKVEVDIFELLRDSEYETAETMCQILPKGVVGVLGPSSSPASSSIISNICGEKEVPHFKVAPEEFLKLQLQRFTTLNLHPSNTDISVAVAGILKFFNCTTACLICAKAECLLNLEKLLRQFLISKDTLSVRMLDDSRDPTPLLKEIRDDKTATIIVHANASMSHTILQKAAELGMASAYYTYIFTNLVFTLLCTGAAGTGKARTVHIAMGFYLHIAVDVQIEIVESVFLGGAQTTGITGRIKLPAATSTTRLVWSMGVMKRLLKVAR